MALWEDARARNILSTHRRGRERRSHSQSLMTLVPVHCSAIRICRSLFLFLASFLSQYDRFALGTCPHLGHPCQKHPSTKTATRWLAKKKSGVPGTELCRSFHPRTEFRINRARRRFSVVALEPALIALILADRCFVVLNLNKFCLSDRGQVAQAQWNVSNRLVRQTFWFNIVIENNC